MLPSRRLPCPALPGRPILCSAVLVLGLLAGATPAASAQEPDLFLPDPAGGADGVELPSADRQIDLLRQAGAASRSGDFQRARSLWERVVETNPYRPEAWLDLAEARAETGDAEGGLGALRRALELGLAVPRGPVLVRAAEVLAAGGRPAMAVDWLQRALAAGYGDRAELRGSEALSRLRGTPGFDSLVADAPPEEDRVAGWRRDIEFFVSEARRMHAAPGRPAHGPRFRALADSLKRAVAGSDDDAAAVGLARLAASLGDGHTWVAPIPADPGSPAELRAGLLPVRLHAFRDGVHVVDARGGARQWVGARVTEVGGRPTAAVLRDLAAFVSRDNPMGLRSTGVSLYLRHTGFLRRVGAADSLGAATFTMAGASGTQRVTLTAGGHRFAGALPVPPELRGDPPLWLADPETRYWMRALPDREAMYVQLNAIRNREEGPDLSEFARAVRDSLEATEARGLALDLRWNGGGDNSLVRPLVRQLVAWEASGEGRTIAVLAGRHTFSAAQNLANRMERWTNAVFVGEPTGSRPNVAGERTDLVLPWSGLRASVANRYWQDSDPGDERPWIAPDVRVEPSARDYFAGRDPVLEAALELVGSGAEGPGLSPGAPR